MTREAAEWEVRAVEARLVRESRWEGDEDEVTSGVRAASVRCRDREGCWEGREDMVAVEATA